MLNKKELQKQVFKIISESINKEEREIMDLREEQIIPTITLFKNIRWDLTASYMMEINDYQEISGEISWNSISNKEDINISFLNTLCVNDGINLSLSQESINFTWHISLIENDLVSEYHL